MARRLNLASSRYRADERSEPPVPQAESRPTIRRPRHLLGRLFHALSRTTNERRARGRSGIEQLVGLCRALLSERGEVSGARRAIRVLEEYGRLDDSGVDQFFDRLVQDFSPDAEAVHRAAEAYATDSSQLNLVQLQRAVEPPRQELFRRFNMAPGATAVLVQMRQRLLETLPSHPERAGVDADLAHLFRSWFNRGFLVLERIDWRTSALVLERLIEYEAVHQIQGWPDLRRRLAADRRCYAFFHPAMPDEPLIFIEVALTRGLATRVQPLLNPEADILDPADTDCAVFYSITNCQDGLRGVSFGNFLIKQVAEDLGDEFPRLKTFATLSPVPGFTKWLRSGADVLQGQISPKLASLLDHLDREAPIDQQAVPENLRTRICALCAYYLLHAKHGREPLDPVARFHLANGASLERLNWLGDTSPAGLKRSLGLMVNYVYRLADVEKNHEAYARQYRIAASGAFERLVKPVFRASGESA
ncbi:MAG: malonyl-CoA decarboxylase [Vicinamibacterales bacterium]